jgi:hypothetical protein
MKTGWLKLFSLIVLCSSSIASAIAITFDDVDASAGDVTLGSYQGLTWTNFLAYTSLDGFPGFNNGIVSPLNAAYSGGEIFGAPFTPIVGSVSSADPFNFESAHLGAGYYDNLQVLVQGSLGGSILYSQSIVVSTTGAAFFDFAFNNIDTLIFSALAGPDTSDPFQCGGFNCTHFTLDDLTLTAATAPPPVTVPEPGSLALFGIGLAAALIRRFKPFASG